MTEKVEHQQELQDQISGQPVKQKRLKVKGVQSDDIFELEIKQIYREYKQEMLRSKGKATDDRDILMSSMRNKNDQFVKDRNIIDDEVRESYIRTVSDMRTARAQSGKGSATARGLTPQHLQQPSTISSFHKGEYLRSLQHQIELNQTL